MDSRSRSLLGEESARIMVVTGPLQFRTNRVESVGQSVLHFIHNKRFHYFMAFLLVLDVLIVISNIAVEIEFYHSAKRECSAYVRELEPDRPNHTWGNIDYYNAKIATMWASIGILSTFCCEHLVLICVLRSSYFNLWNVLDLFIIVTSLALELVFPDAEGGLLILARSWRFARIFHGLMETSHTVQEFEHSLGEKKEDLDTAFCSMNQHVQSFCPDVSPRFNAMHSLTPAQIKVVAQRLARDHPDIIVDLVSVTGNFMSAQHNNRTQSHSLAPERPSLNTNTFGRSQSRSNLF